MDIANPVGVYRDFEDAHWWYLARRSILAPLLAEVVPPNRGTTLVDVGCGAGANVAAFAGDYRCVGIDISEELVEAGRSRFPDVTFIHGAAPEALGEIAGTADAFLLMDVIEHIADDHQYFARLFQAARTGSTFFVTVPADPALWSPHDVTVGHQRRYVAATLRALWADLPAKELLVEYFNYYLYPLIRTARTINNLVGRGSGESGTDFAMPPAPANRALAAIMGSERHRLLGRLRGDQRRGFRRGVSLMAIVRKV